MNNNIGIIHPRPILADKLQIHVSPHYCSIDDDTELYYDGHLSPFFEKEIQQEYGSKIVRFNNRPYLHLPNNFNTETSPFIWNTRISLRKPFTIAFDYNFIRKLNHCVSLNADYHYNKKYKEKIQLHDDNYIDDLNIWTNWDHAFIFKIISSLKEEFIDFATSTFHYLTDDYDLPYTITSLKHTEFNKDYYVGSNQSLRIILAFEKFISSSRGRQWRTDLQTIAMSQYTSNEDVSQTMTHQDGSTGHTFKFQLCKGLSYKVYQKTTDHIRTEITFDGSFIKRKLKSYRFEECFEPLFNFSEAFFRISNFEGILYLLNKETLTDETNKVNKILNFTDRCLPHLSNIIQNIIYDLPISDATTISYLRRQQKMRPLFTYEIDHYGHPVYSYDPNNHKQHRIRMLPKKVKPTKEMPYQPVKQCLSCHSYYQGLLCPYCKTFHSPQGFNEFMEKVKKYKESNYHDFKE